MKIVIAEGYISSVVNLGENHGEEIVSGTAIRIECAVVPKAMDAFSPSIRNILFTNDIPAIAELGECKWEIEYEKAKVEIAGLKFTKADVKKIVFKPRAGFLFDLALTIKVNADEDQRGVLTGLVKQTVEVVIEKMTQKVIEIGKEDEKDDAQGDLNINPLLTKEKLDEIAAADTKH